MGLAERGARLALLDVDLDAMRQSRRELEALGTRAECYSCDVSSEADVVAAFRSISEDFGPIHGLVNNAGILRDATLIKTSGGKVVGKMSEGDFCRVVDVHMKGAFLCAREAAAQMAEAALTDACIVSISSAAQAGNYGQANYSAAKAGIVAMSRTLMLYAAL